MQQQWDTRVYGADTGADSGAGAAQDNGADTTATSAGQAETEREKGFTPEQQAKVDKIIQRAKARIARKAQEKAAASAPPANNATMDERIAALELREARLNGRSALDAERLILDGEDAQSINQEILSLVAHADEKVAKTRAKAIAQLIERRVQAEVDARLGQSRVVPQQNQTNQTMPLFLCTAQFKNSSSTVTNS